MSLSPASGGGRARSPCEAQRPTRRPPHSPGRGTCCFYRGRGCALGSSRGSADFEQSRIALIASARCLPAAGLRPCNLLLADKGENGAEPLVLDNLGLGEKARTGQSRFFLKNLGLQALPQLVEGAVSQLTPLYRIDNLPSG